jgi:pantetheine-phosphate adenylyltransferase
MKKIAVYAGTFDPPTLGHQWMIEQAAQLFDEVVVAIGVNPEKKTTFSIESRIAMLTGIAEAHPNVQVTSFENQYLMHYAVSIGARFVIRGIRNGGDYEYEKTLRNVNDDLDCNVATVFLMPPRAIAEVSSSVVKGLVGPVGWERVVARYVPQAVLRRLIGLHHAMWCNLVAMGARGDQQQFWDEILTPYLDANRAYHNLYHITAMLEVFYQIQHLLQDPVAVEAAIWGHDLDYDTRAHDNEESSGRRMRSLLVSLGLPDEFSACVDDLIVATKHTQALQDLDASYLVDLDLMILGKSEQEFDQYEQGIRREYAWVSEEQFRQARADILKSFLQRTPIYSTEYFRERYEQMARQNLQRSLANLQHKDEAEISLSGYNGG